jgi:hypothetical protein
MTRRRAGTAEWRAVAAPQYHDIWDRIGGVRRFFRAANGEVAAAGCGVWEVQSRRR